MRSLRRPRSEHLRRELRAVSGAKPQRRVGRRAVLARPRRRRSRRATASRYHFLRGQALSDVWSPSKAERSQVGKYWNAVDTFLSTGSRASLDRFAGASIYDEISGQRLPFVTDPAIIIAHSDEFAFGLCFYRDRREVQRFAA